MPALFPCPHTTRMPFLYLSLSHWQNEHFFMGGPGGLEMDGAAGELQGLDLNGRAHVNQYVKVSKRCWSIFWGSV